MGAPGAADGRAVARPGLKAKRESVIGKGKFTKSKSGKVVSKMSARAKKNFKGSGCRS